MSLLHEPVVVIGGGAAGILAAWKAATSHAPVLLLERNARLGIKILISGGGKCNITHAGTMVELGEAFQPNERRFLKPSFFRFGNTDLLRILHDAGVPAAARDDGRVFPEHGTARDVVIALEQLCQRSGVEIRTGIRVQNIATRGSAFKINVSGNRPTPARAEALHRHEVFWQITFPFAIALLLILCMVAGLILVGVKGLGDISRWADIALIWLLIPVIILTLISFFAVTGFIYLITRLLGVLPGYARLGQDYVYLFQVRSKKIANQVVEPFLKLRSFKAGAEALWQKPKKG